MKQLITLLLLLACTSVYAQPVQFEFNPAFGVSGGRVATGMVRPVSNGTGGGDFGPFPGAFSVTTALNFKTGKSGFFPSWGVRVGIYSLSVGSSQYNPYVGNSDIAFVTLGMPAYLNYIHTINKTVGLRFSAGVEAMTELTAGTSSFAAEGVAGFILASRISIGLKYYQPFGNYATNGSGSDQYNFHSFLLDFKFRRAGW